MTITVTGVNDTPITSGTPGDQANADNDAITTLDVSGHFSDVDGDTLTYSATDLPTGLTIDADTGVISGTIDNSASQDGPFNVVVTATDPWGQTTTLSFNWTVTNPGPTATDNTAAVNVTNTTSTGNVISDDDGLGVDSDPDGDELTVSRIAGTTDFGIAVPGEFGEIVVLNDGSYTYTLDTGNSDVVALGGNETLTETFFYRIVDGEGGTDFARLTITITGGNDAPITGGTIPSQTNDDADSITAVDVTSVFSDPDGDTLTYTAAGLPAGLTCLLYTSDAADE